MRSSLRRMTLSARTVEAGLSEDAAVAKVFLPQYASMPRYEAWMPFNVRATYRALRGGG